MPMDKEERERLEKLSASGHFQTPEFQKRIDAQSAEFKALDELMASYRSMPAIVDDDYPSARHHFEGKVTAYLAACKANGRNW